MHERSCQRMDRSVDDWIIQLRARFTRSPIDAEDDADRCKFSFAQENRMVLRTYLTLKQNLLVEAGVEGPRTKSCNVSGKIWIQFYRSPCISIPTCHWKYSFSDSIFK